MSNDVTAARIAFCKEHGTSYSPADAEAICGLAWSTKGLFPIHGLRHPSTDNATGWYVWRGDEYSNRTDFFTPLCTDHLCTELPEISKMLGLPAGYRFLLADGHLDLWFDESLLSI